MIAIVGGGMAGLAAAYELTSRRVPFTLYEGSDRLGGLVHTDRTAGFTVEAGADSMLAQKRAGLELCSALGVGHRLIASKPPRTAFVLKGRVLYPLPSPSMLGIPTSWRGLAGYSLLPPSARLRVAAESLVPARRAHEDESIAAYFQRRFGRATVPLLAEPLLGGIHAGDVRALSMPALFPGLANAERTRGSVRRWMRETAARSDSDGAFRSLAGGMSELVEAIRDYLPPGSVRVGSMVGRITPAKGGWELRTRDSVAAYTSVILACPAHAAAGILRATDTTAADLCAGVRYVSTLSVALAWPRTAVAHPLNGSGFVVARRYTNRRITACTWVSSKWEHRAPDGYVLLRAYLGGAHDPGALDMSDDGAAELARRELSEILSISGRPVLARVHRWRQAGAQHEMGHLARMAALEERLSRLAGLFVTGSGFRSIGIPDCIADGRAVGARAGAFSYAT